MEGWEVSSDRIEKYQKMLSIDPIGDPIITSKCKLDRANGFLVVSDNGYSWRLQKTASSGGYSPIKNKWVRWHDVANLREIKPGTLLVEIKLRKNRLLITDKFGNPKIKKWKISIRPNKGEPGESFRQRQQYFHYIMSELHNRNKVLTDPPTSDSRM